MTDEKKTYDVLCSITLQIEADNAGEARELAMDRLCEIGVAPCVIDVEE